MTSLFQNDDKPKIADPRERLKRVQEKLNEESLTQGSGLFHEIGLIIHEIKSKLSFLSPLGKYYAKYFHVFWFAIAMGILIIVPANMIIFIHNNDNLIFYDSLNRRVQVDIKTSDIIQLDGATDNIEKVGQFGKNVFNKSENLDEVKKTENSEPSDIEQFGTAQLMVPAPDPGLVESSPNGLLPIIGNDNRKPWQVYGKYFDPIENRPKVAVIVAELGFSAQITYAALQLPPATSMAFTPYIKDLEQWVRNARSGGHEVFLMLPMEPADYPYNDPGPLAILEDKTDDENTQNLLKIMGKTTGYVGFVPSMGDNILNKPAAMELILNVVKRRGLAMIDPKVNLSSVLPRMAQKLSVPWTQADYYIQRPIDPEELNLKLAEFEKIAKDTGSLLLIIKPYPVLLNQINAWLRTLDQKEIMVQPATAIIAHRSANRVNRGFINQVENAKDKVKAPKPVENAQDKDKIPNPEETPIKAP